MCAISTVRYVIEAGTATPGWTSSPTPTLTFGGGRSGNVHGLIPYDWGEVESDETVRLRLHDPSGLRRQRFHGEPDHPRR
jgi:hypothetical protein